MGYNGDLEEFHGVLLGISWWLEFHGEFTGFNRVLDGFSGIQWAWVGIFSGNLVEIGISPPVIFHSFLSSYNVK